MAVSTAIAVTLSPLVTDLIASLLAARAPIVMAARFETREAALRGTAHSAPDLVLIGLFPNETDQVVRDLQNAFPRATVATFSHGGRRVGIHALGAPLVALEDGAPDALADAILTSLSRRGGAIPSAI